jgi:hypothetical protein
MRTWRLSLAGTVILALVGGLGGVVLAQDDEDEVVGATHVTGASEGYRMVSEGSMSWTDAGASFRGEVQEREVEWSDPRLPSSMRLSQNLDYYALATDVEDGAAPLDVLRETVGGVISLAQNVRLEDADGAWTGTIHGLLEETMVGRYPQTVLMVLEGEGAYAGLSAMFTTTYEEPPAQRQVPDWVGYILEGEMTPVPEPPEPSATQ